MSTDERSARMALCALLPMGSADLSDLVAADGALAVWQGVTRMSGDSAWGRKSEAIDPAALVAATASCEARFLIPGDAEWPPQVGHLDAVRLQGQGTAPLGLWVRGTARLDELDGAVALVGARASTAYGNHVATELAADLALMRRVVVSGLAHGIDGAAHRGALGVRKPTVALVAGGVDAPYPASHARLMDAIIGNGAVVSEAPPGARPMKASFLARNRIIAALSDGVVVVEAAARSGARNTAAWAHSLSRHVMAVPGPVTSAMSATPNRLIRDGEAVLVTCADDIASQLSPLAPEAELPLRGEDQPLDRLPPVLRQLREVFRPRHDMGVAALAGLTGLSVPECLAGVDELVELGWVEEAGPSTWRLPGRR